MSKRVWVALGLYAILALIAIFELDGFLRNAVLFFLAILTTKTLLHSKDEEMD